MRKNKKRTILFLFFCLLMMIATACGAKSEGKVTKKLQDTLNGLNGYKVDVQMTMKTGEEDRTYDIDVWYKKGQEDFYRVVLQNDGDDEEGGQIILKNDEGVFVLTPALKKSFKFQKDWPDNSSQPYLYQSLVKDVLDDSSATFSVNETHYIYQTKTNYQNKTNLPYQAVYFDKKTYLPTDVKILDENKNVLIDVTFAKFEKNPQFAQEDFNRESILESAFAHVSATSMEEYEEFAVLYPLETLGSELIEKKEVAIEDGERIILTFKGNKNFTLIQEKLSTLPTSLSYEEVSGDVVNLGHSIGAVSDHVIEWNYKGTDFYLASEDLTTEELITVASSIQGKAIK